jgi:hypothetical protein
MPRDLVGAVFRDDIEAGQAVRALHYWNRKRRLHLGIMCVLVRKSSGGSAYRPYRVVRGRRAARWGFLLGAVTVGLLGAGAALATASALETVASWVKLANDTVSGFIGSGTAINVRSLLRQASDLAGGPVVVLGVGGAIVGGVAGAIVFWFLGTIAHLFKGFGRSVRREVLAELEPGTAAVLTWAKGSTAVMARDELERLGGNAPLEEPAKAEATATDAAAPASDGAGARSWAPPRS